MTDTQGNKGTGDGEEIAARLREWLFENPLCMEAADAIDALVKALESIQQRANESGTGEMALIDTIHAMHKIARAALALAKGGS